MPVFRFAPSPNGALHLGHALSALLNQDLADRFGGQLLLRIEDIDPVRCRPERIGPMLADLEWLGLRWPEPIRRQSEHMADYAAALAQLETLGLLYSCFASRREVQRAANRLGDACDPDGAPRYPGRDQVIPVSETWVRAAAGEPFVLRLDMDKALQRVGKLPPVRMFSADGAISERQPRPELWGDVVLARKDIATSYHLSVVVDDAVQGVTHVVRGQDLEWATDLHRLLQSLLGLASPLYLHHRLIRGGDGAKLSKSRGDTALAALRQAGVKPSEIRELVGLG